MLKNGKAPGIDNIPPYILTTDVDTTAKLLHPLMAQIWQEEKYSNDWNTGIVIKLPITRLIKLQQLERYSTASDSR
jgi:hypothetical protein